MLYPYIPSGAPDLSCSPSNPVGGRLQPARRASPSSRPGVKPSSYQDLLARYLPGVPKS